MALMNLELHYATNWAYEGQVDVLYVDTGTGGEKSYGQLAQGSYMTRETYAGHTWNVREVGSRELLMSVVAKPNPAGGPQIVQIGSEASLDPLKAAVWRMGRAPREPLLAAVGTLSRILTNVIKNPDEAKYRSLKATNAKVAAALDVPGTLALLGSAGFEQSYVDGEPRLVLPSGRPTAPIEAANAQLTRLDCLLTGKPPPTESLASMQASHQATTNAQSSANAAAASEPSHRCSACGKGINNDLRKQLAAGSNEIGGWRSHQWNGGGEYRFHCSKCNVDLCSICYDKWKAGNNHASSSSAAIDISDGGGGGGVGGSSIHPLTCQFTIEAPIETHWGNTPRPPPPPVNSRNRRGPWG